MTVVASEQPQTPAPILTSDSSYGRAESVTMAVINGDGGDNTLNGTNSADTINGFGGNDTIDGRNGNDVINAGDGDDVIRKSGNSRDTVFAGEGNDIWLPTETGAAGNSDTVFLEGGDDTAFLGFVSNVPGVVEQIDGGTGSDTFDYSNFSPFALNTTIQANGTLNFNGGLVANNVYTNFENITGGNGNDTMTGNGVDNVLTGNGGNDRLFGNGGEDTLLGGAGNDDIDAGAGFDNVDGGTGNDTILGGGDNDILTGGDDADLIRIASLDGASVKNTTVNGGSGGNDNDILDISQLIAEGWTVTNFVANPEANGNPGFNGQVQLQRGAEAANINFTDIEGFVAICFTPGARIATPRGEVAVEALKVGDTVFTRDNGIRDIRWIGRSGFDCSRATGHPDLAPVLIRKGALGNGLPQRDLLVSPNHRVLVTDRDAAVLFGETELLVAAKHLTSRPGIDRVETDRVVYLHLLFDDHEVILSDGAWTESFQPGDYSLKGLGAAQRREILKLFPELATRDGRDAYRSARKALKRHEVSLLSA